MRLTTGWINEDEYFIVKPLHNGCRQSLVMSAHRWGSGKWNIVAGIFSSYATYNSICYSTVWVDPTSTNKNPSIKVLSLALESLNEIEQEIHKQAMGKRTFIYVDGLDKRRLRIYTKLLTKRCGYKKSTIKSEYVDGMPILYKRV